MTLSKSETLSFDVEHPGSGLIIKICMDGHEVWQCDRAFSGPITVVVPADEGSHQLEISMSGKRPDHTQIDSQQNIISDVMISLKNIRIDNVNIDQIVSNLAVYEHDCNGTRLPMRDRFFGHMGCNGRVMLDFQSPIYIWLLENM